MSGNSPSPEVLVPLPPELARIAQVCQRRPAVEAVRAVQQAVAAAHIAEAHQRVPEVKVAGGGESLHLGDLSPGCQACKAGTWDCIFTHIECNVDCGFCLLPRSRARRRFGSVFGGTPADAARNHEKTRIDGISFSGGEPLLDLAGLLDWLRWFSGVAPRKYYWLYTNGLKLRDGDLQQLAKAGLHEVRFNLAASGYDNPFVMQRVAEAAVYLPAVTVEIPAIPEDRVKVLDSLKSWSAAGVKYLNLHEFMYEPETNSGDVPGPRFRYTMEDGHECAVNPFSRGLTLEVMEVVAHQRLSLSVNDCSMQSKALQLRGRRRCLAPLYKLAHEDLTHDDVLESACGVLKDEVIYCSMADLTSTRARYPHHRWFHLARKAPLSPGEPPCWTEIMPA